MCGNDLYLNICFIHLAWSIVTNWTIAEKRLREMDIEAVDPKQQKFILHIICFVTVFFISLLHMLPRAYELELIISLSISC